MIRLLWFYIRRFLSCITAFLKAKMDLVFPPFLIDAIGVAGFCLYVLNYTLLTLRVLSGNSPRYFALNLTAATCVLIGLTGSFNLASAMIQFFWVAMSVIGLILHFVRPVRAV